MHPQVLVFLHKQKFLSVVCYFILFDKVRTFSHLNRVTFKIVNLHIYYYIYVRYKSVIKFNCSFIVEKKITRQSSSLL